MFTSEQSSESSNDYNDDTINDHDLEDENYYNPIPVVTAIKPVWDFNLLV